MWGEWKTGTRVETTAEGKWEGRKGMKAISVSPKMLLGKIAGMLGTR